MERMGWGFLGSAAVCLAVLLFGDRLGGSAAGGEMKLIDTDRLKFLEAQNRDLRGEWWQMRREKVEVELAAGKALAERDEQRARADAAESRVAHLEQRLETLRVLGDAARREGARVKLPGDDPGDRIPPQAVPVPAP